MTKEALKKKDAALGFISLTVMATIYFWGDITKSDLYQKTFHKEKWEASQRELAEFAARLGALDRRECAILVRAGKDIALIEIERLVLFGIDRDSAKEIVVSDIVLGEKLCAEHGISPFHKTNNAEN